uniref:Uncharacterized protein n=1 Tax=Coccidioides posadasii RMSCC 3488 TaxID=454284 RepID=A0A0J6FLL0_COCPO|nr:hypothetical protein CPAG_06622 [Coccidioides posadasii RMSCC 3488]
MYCTEYSVRTTVTVGPGPFDDDGPPLQFVLPNRYLVPGNMPSRACANIDTQKSIVPLRRVDGSTIRFLVCPVGPVTPYLHTPYSVHRAPRDLNKPPFSHQKPPRHRLWAAQLATCTRATNILKIFEDDFALGIHLARVRVGRVAGSCCTFADPSNDK